MAKNLLILALAVAVLGLATSLIRVENERYALLLGLCRKEALTKPEDFACLERVQTRTSPVWHLYYAVLGGS